jgi:hypothetical protein
MINVKLKMFSQKEIVIFFLTHPRPFSLQKRRERLLPPLYQRGGKGEFGFPQKYDLFFDKK